MDPQPKSKTVAGLPADSYVAVVAHDLTGVTEIVDSIGLAADITDRTNIRKLLDDVALAYGGFDSICVTAGVFVPADDVILLAASHVDVSLSAAEISALPEHTEERGFELGMVGLLRKHVGWVREKDR